MARSAENRQAEFGVSLQNSRQRALVADLSAEPPEVSALTTDALDALEHDARRLGQEMAAAVADEVESFSLAAEKDPSRLPRLAGISELTVLTLVKVTREGREPTEHELAFIQDVGAERAAASFPLEALIHGLRVGQHVIWKHLVAHLGVDPWAARALVVLTEKLLRYGDRLSTTIATAYVSTQRAQAADHERRVGELMDEIISGRFPFGPDTPARLAVFGLHPDEACAVLVAAPSGTRTVFHPPVRAKVIAALERHSHRQGAALQIRARDSDLVAIVSPPGSAPWIAQATLRDLSYDGRSPIAIGISETCPKLRDAARGYVEAARALVVVQQRGGVASLNDIRVFEYLIAHADASAQQLLPEAMRDVANESTGRAALLETLEAYLDSDLSIPATASRLSVHTNTVRYRLEKLEKLTGLDVRNFWDLVELGSSLRILSRQAPDGSRAL
jgi:hypothetical protein